MAKLSTISVVRPVIVAVMALAWAAPSHAYLDPGTGSIILQSILAGVAVAIGVLRLYWYRFKSFLSSLTGAPREIEGNGKQDFAQDSDASQDS